MKKVFGSPEEGFPPPIDSAHYLTPAQILSHNCLSEEAQKPSPDPESHSLSSINPKKSPPSSFSQRTERQFSDLNRARESSSGSSIHLSFSNASFKRQRTGHTEEDAITRSILEDISDHELLYSSNRKPSKAHRIGISLLTDVELGKVTEEADSQKLGGLCSQFSMELRNTKEELAKLYRENKDLRGQLRAQEDHIQSLNVHYTDQTECLRQELAELRNALYGLEGQQGISTDDLPPLRAEPCCQLF